MHSEVEFEWKTEEFYWIIHLSMQKESSFDLSSRLIREDGMLLQPSKPATAINGQILEVSESKDENG